MKNSIILIAFNVIFSIFFSIFVGFRSFAFLNCSFIISMIYLLFGVLCFVWEKGFFNITLFSFNKLAQQLNKKRGILIEESNLQLSDYTYKENSFYYTSHLILCGSIMAIFITVVSFYLI